MWIFTQNCILPQFLIVYLLSVFKLGAGTSRWILRLLPHDEQCWRLRESNDRGGEHQSVHHHSPATGQRLRHQTAGFHCRRRKRLQCDPHTQDP